MKDVCKANVPFRDTLAEPTFHHGELTIAEITYCEIISGVTLAGLISKDELTALFDAIQVEDANLRLRAKAQIQGTRKVRFD